MKRILIIAIVSISSFACANDESDQKVSTTLNFKVKVGSSELDTSQEYTLGTTDGSSPATDIKITDLRLFVHNLHLVTAGGQKVAVDLLNDGLWQDGSVALLDFESGTGLSGGSSAVNKSIKGQISAGSYTGVEFTVGVPASKNHISASTTGAPYDAAGMQWNWRDGFRYLTLQAQSSGDSTKKAVFHLGATGDKSNGTARACGSTGDATDSAPSTDCVYRNLATISLSTSAFTGDSPPSVILNLEPLMQGINLGLVGSGMGEGHQCHSTPDSNTAMGKCKEWFNRLGLTFYDYQGATTNPAKYESTGQTVFSLE